MPPAWQAREAKQQTFIEALVREVHDEADRLDRYPSYIAEFLSMILMQFQLEIARQDGRWETEPAEVVRETDAWRHLAKLLPRIRAFARVRSEDRVLLMQLFRKLEPAIESWASGGYNYDRIVNPQDVYGTRSAMDEVEL